VAPEIQSAGANNRFRIGVLTQNGGLMKSPLPFLPGFMGPLISLAWLSAAPVAAEVADNFVPCQIQQRVKVQFPVRAFHEGITHGTVWLLLEVHREGRLGDVLAFAHSGEEFAREALDAVEKWTFAPARLDGEPIRSINTINVQFEVNGVTAYTKLIGQPERHVASGKPYAYRPFMLNELDGVPKAVARSSPIYPTEWIKEGRTGAVTIDYFIDEEGNTRFPRVVGDADELLAATTVEAVKLWQFEPPLRHGRPVLAQVRQTFHFRPEKSTSDRE
jgi:TonB family protein